MNGRSRGVVWLLLATSGLVLCAGTKLGSLQTGFVTFFSTPAPAPQVSSAPPTSQAAVLPSIQAYLTSASANGPQAAPAAGPDSFLPAPAPAQAPAASVGGALVSGACGFGALSAADWPYNEVVAVGPNNSIVTGIGANKLACGQCIKATCASSNCALNSSDGVLLQVADSCSGCAANQLNVPAATFTRHFGSSLSLGRVNVTYQQVDCDAPGTIQVKVVQSTEEGGGYLALVLLSVAGSGMLAGVDLKTSGSQTWAPMANRYGNVWQASGFGAAPLDLRITSFQGDSLIAKGVITEISNSTFSTTVQFGPTAPAVAPSIGATSSAKPPTPTKLPVLAPQPNPYLQASPPASLLLGSRVTVPLYYAPADLTALGAYPGLVFSYVECTPTPPVLNLTIARMMVPSADGSAVPAFALHTLVYRTVRTANTSIINRIVDYTFFNLETGELAKLYQPQVASFYDPSFSGSTPVTELDTQATLYPRYYAPSDLSGPADFDYTVLLPPGPNENPTSSYLQGLKTLFYLLTTLALGNPGTGQELLTCSPGYAQVGTWADYVRGIISQLAPPEEIVDDLYQNMPLGDGFSFQDTSFVLSNALVVGNTVNTTKQLSSRDCGASCRPNLAFSGTGQALCSAWSWCGSISGCGATPYQTCVLKNSTAALNITAPDGFLNVQRNGSIRFTSGVLILPPPTGLSFDTLDLSASAPSGAVNFGLMANASGVPQTG